MLPFWNQLEAFIDGRRGAQCRTRGREVEEDEEVEEEEWGRRRWWTRRRRRERKEGGRGLEGRV